MDPALDAVVVLRWLNSAHADEFFGKVLAAVDSR
jgi:hypothetical protein